MRRNDTHKSACVKIHFTFLKHALRPGLPRSFFLETRVWFANVKTRDAMQHRSGPRLSNMLSPSNVFALRRTKLLVIRRGVARDSPKRLQMLIIASPGPLYFQNKVVTNCNTAKNKVVAICNAANNKVVTNRPAGNHAHITQC